MRDRACSRSTRGRRTARATHAGPPPREPVVDADTIGELAPDVAVSVLRDIGAAPPTRRFLESRAGQPSGWPARASRTVGRGSHPARAGAPAEEARSGLTAAGDRAPSDAGARSGAHDPAGPRPGDGRIDGGVSAGAAPPYRRCGGRGGGAPCQPNVRTMGKLASPPGSSSSSPAWNLLCSIALFSMFGLDPCPAPDVRRCSRSRLTGLRERCARPGEAGQVVVTMLRFRRPRVPPVPRSEAADGVCRQRTPPSRS